MANKKLGKFLQNSKKYRRVLRNYCSRNAHKFLEDTSLHGLKYITDRKITIWERTFFLCSFLAAVYTTANLISNIYSKWDSTPVIIGISPHPTSIMDIPFPAVTVCNMNQALYSKVSKYDEDSFERVVLKVLCSSGLEFDEDAQNASTFLNNNLKIAEFVQEHSQPCSKLLMHCAMGSVSFNCSTYFREIITDEGICCVFNVLHPKFLFKGNYSIIDNITKVDNRVPVNWNPEMGYPKDLPHLFYPMQALGTGISMGLSLIVNAELDDYYCSTTNGPGFKFALHNPAETPLMKDAGITFPIGFESRFRIEVQRAEAMPTLRKLPRKSRQCIFNDEQKLLYYNFYTRQSCERECQAKHIFSYCQCIPYNLPLLFSNASICSVKDTFCISKAKKIWTSDTNGPCRRSCLPNCFDLSYQTVSSTVALVKRNYTIPSPLLFNMSKVYANTNCAVVHFYYGESAFHGNLKNVYIGFTEFLSNTGGIMGLFMGFSFISVAEIIYFAFLRPISELHAARKKRKQIEVPREQDTRIWLGEEIYFGKPKSKLSSNGALVLNDFHRSAFAVKMRQIKQEKISMDCKKGGHNLIWA